MDVYIPEPRLYYDLFLEIFRCIPRQCDVAALMSTCKTLWIDGVKYLLAFPVVIRQPSTLRSFCTFMLNDIPFRTPLLRQFYLMISVDLRDWDTASEDEDDRDSEPGQYPRMSQDLVSMLARVLENTTNLEDLSMERPDNLFYTIDDESFVSAAIANLERVRRFHGTGVIDLSKEILTIAKSSLVELDMDFCSYPSEILHFATRHAATLEKLTVRNGQLADLYGDISAPELPGTDRISCPRVHTLVLRHLDVLEDAAAIYDTFPALRHLELSMATDEEVDAEEMRQDSAPEDDGEYPRDVLDRLCGAVNALYGLCGAYGAHILEVYRIFSDEEQLKRLRTVISDVQPTHLVLHAGENYPGAGAHFSPMDILFLLPEEDTKLTHLVLNMEISALKGVHSTLSAFLFALIELLRAHPVQFLILRFLKHAVYDQELEETKILQQDALAGNLWDEDKPNEIVEGLSSKLMPLVIRRLFEADNVLAHLVVDIEGKGCDYWEIHDSHGDLQMWMLDDTAGRALVQAEGLGLRDGRVEAFCDPILRNY